MSLKTCIIRYFPHIVITLMLLLVAIITWVVTHGEVTRLTARIAEQEAQLQRFHHYQQVLSEQQPPVERKLRFDWQIAAWANQLSLQLTLQPLSHDRTTLTVAANGRPLALQQLLSLIMEYSIDGRWQQPWQLQRLSWKVAAAGSAQVSWQVTANMAATADANSSLNAPEVSQVDSVNGICSDSSPSLSEHHPSLNQLQLLAIIQSSAVQQNSLVYWRTAGGDRIATKIHDWFSEPLAQITDIQADHVQLTHWTQVEDCWLTRKHYQRLQEH